MVRDYNRLEKNSKNVESETSHVTNNAQSKLSVNDSPKRSTYKRESS